MSYQEKLYEFLEQELPVEQENELFTELASNAELRSEMKDVLSMNRAVASDARAFTVPVGSVKSVFSTLGYMAPAAVGAGAATGFLAFVKSGYGVAAASLLSALVTTGVFFGLGGVIPSSDTTEPEVAVPVIAERFEPIEMDMVLLPAPEPPKANAAVQSGVFNQHTQTRERVGANADGLGLANDAVTQDKQPDMHQGIHNNGVVGTNLPPAKRNVVESSYSYAIEPVHAMSVTDSRSIDVFSSGKARPESAPLYSLPGSFFPSPDYFVVEVRQMTTWSMDNPDVSPAANAGPANFAVSLGIPTAKESRVVLDFGRESYYMNFTQHLNNGGSVTHRKNPLMWWGGVGYRHIFNPDGVVQPFTQAVIGAAEAGPMGRLMAGAEVSLSTSIKLFGAVEGSSMFYSLDGTNYLSSNLGVVYGLSLNL